MSKISEAILNKESFTENILTCGTKDDMRCIFIKELGSDICEETIDVILDGMAEYMHERAFLYFARDEDPSSGEFYYDTEWDDTIPDYAEKDRAWEIRIVDEKYEVIKHRIKEDKKMNEPVRFNRGRLIEKIQNQIEEDIAYRLANIQNHFGIIDGGTYVGFNDEIRTLVKKYVEALEDQYYRADRCPYCGRVINPKSHAEFKFKGIELSCCDKECLNWMLDDHVDVIDEEE